MIAVFRRRRCANCSQILRRQLISNIALESWWRQWLETMRSKARALKEFPPTVPPEN